ncbi:MAG TPA: hypothetical protein VFW29_07815 [Solirubrobacteraceae bacterium]|nr:hypothetical protein [Solirubrobacteraceae bacterium]
MSAPRDPFEAFEREARARLGAAPGRDGSQVRTYRGRTVEELIPQIERDFGADALIVRRREGLRGGVLGFFQHAFVEIEAMPGTPRLDLYDDPEDAAPRSPVVREEPAPAAAHSVPPLATSGAGATYPPAMHAYGAASAGPPQLAPPLTPNYDPHQPPASAAPAPSDPAVATLPAAPPAPPGPWGDSAPLDAPAALPGQQISGAGLPTQDARRAAYATGAPPPAVPERRDDFGSYVTPELAALARAEHARVPRPEPARPPAPGAAPSVDFQELLGPESERPTGRSEPLAPPLRASLERRTVVAGSHGRARAGVLRSLRRYGISEEFALELIAAASAHTLPLSPRAGLAQAVRSTLVQRIPVVAPMPAKGAAVLVLGPGGAGKTTVCATLLDAYRAGSTLRASYATLIRPADAEELSILLAPQILEPARAGAVRSQRALHKARTDGLAILDTPSLSPTDRTGIRALATLVAEVQPERVIVALPATLGAAPAHQLLEALAPLAANSLAVTHAEETDQIGVAVEAACRHGIAPEYLLDRAPSSGWRLQRADPAELAARILP